MEKGDRQTHIWGGLILLSLFIFIVFSNFVYPAFANGGDQRVVEGKYLINLSRSPFTPREGERAALLASFVDLEANRLIAEELNVRIRIAKLAPEIGKREFIFEKKDNIVKEGVLEFSYTFAKPGLHEIFFDFAFSKEPQKIYEAPDFLLDIQKRVEEKLGIWTLAGSAVGIFVAGILIGYIIHRKIQIPPRTII